MRPTLNEYLMSIAHVVATRATCPRRKVGCVFADDAGHILATGYNGGLRGAPHCGTYNEAYEEGKIYKAVNGYDILIIERHEGSSVHAPGMVGEMVVPHQTQPHYVRYNLDGVCIYAAYGSKDGLHLQPIQTACAGLNDPPTAPSRCEAIHAEINALLQCKDRDSATTVICTLSPCATCARLLQQGLPNLRTVLFKDKYVTDEGLKALGTIKWVQL